MNKCFKTCFTFVSASETDGHDPGKAGLDLTVYVFKYIRWYVVYGAVSLK